MNKETKYYFTFYPGYKDPVNGNSLYLYWIELIGADTKAEARDIMCKLYGGGFTHHTEKTFQPDLYKNGCYRQIHLPLPEDIHLNFSDPFLSEKKKSSKLSSGENRRKNDASGGTTKLTVLMNQHNVSINTVARATGVSLPAVQALRQGYKLRPKTMKALSDFFNVTPQDLI